MATKLEELAQQGDPGTLETEEQASKIKLQNPQQLYELWERQQWLSQDIDFSKDKRDWAEMDEDQKWHLTWLLAAFFIGEERVTTQFSGLVMAYEDEQEEAFLTSQQVDEARHVQFFDRFYREVMGVDHDAIGDRLQKVREELNDAFVELFDGALVDAGKRLIADPTDREAKVDFVTIYHMVIEGTLALTGQNYIIEYLENHDLMPGFVEGFSNVARDEHRHMAYGTWYLQQAVVEDRSLGERVQARLEELIPTAAGVLVPPGQDPNEDYKIFDYTGAELHEFAFKALTRRLKAIGVPLPGAAVAA